VFAFVTLRIKIGTRHERQSLIATGSPTAPMLGRASRNPSASSGATSAKVGRVPLLRELAGQSQVAASDMKPDEKFAEIIDSRWDGIAAYCKPENTVSPGFVEGLSNNIRVIQRRAYGLRDEDYLRLKVLTCMLSELYFGGD
jgi:Transposase